MCISAFRKEVGKLEEKAAVLDKILAADAAGDERTVQLFKKAGFTESEIENIRSNLSISLCQTS